MTGADEDQPDEAATFEVMVEENSHHGEDAYLSESFTSAKEALDHAREIVDEFFEGMSGKTEEELYEQFIHFGDSPYILGVEFSAREYARTRCAELGEGLPEEQAVPDERVDPQPVDCGCDPGYRRAVLTYSPSSSLDYRHVGVFACLHCGRLGVAEAILDEPHPHDVQLVGYRPIELAEEMQAWLQQWPRLTTRGLDDDEVFVPASFRAETLDELRRVEEQSAAEQKGMGWSARLIGAGVPAEPPREAIPDFLEAFRDVLEGLELTDATPLEELVQRAARAGGAARLACDRLFARADLAGDLAGLLPPRGSELDQAALDVVGTMRLADDPRIISELQQRIARADPSDEFEVHRIAVAVSRLGASAQPLVTALEALAGRIRPSEDYYLHKLVLDTIERMSPEASLVKVLEDAVELVQRPGNDFMLSFWGSAEEATEELVAILASMRQGAKPMLEEADFLFDYAGVGTAPSPLQEMCMSSGSDDDFLHLADRYNDARQLVSIQVTKEAWRKKATKKKAAKKATKKKATKKKATKKKATKKKAGKKKAAKKASKKRA